MSTSILGTWKVWWYLQLTDWISRSRLQSGIAILSTDNLIFLDAKGTISKDLPNWRQGSFTSRLPNIVCPTGLLLLTFSTEENNTSGVQIYAKTKEALAEFRHQRQQGKVLMDSWHSCDSLQTPFPWNFAADLRKTAPRNMWRWSRAVWELMSQVKAWSFWMEKNCVPRDV